MQKYILSLDAGTQATGLSCLIVWAKLWWLKICFTLSVFGTLLKVNNIR